MELSAVLWEENQNGIGTSLNELNEVCWVDSGVDSILRSSGEVSQIGPTRFRPNSGLIDETIGMLGQQEGFIYLVPTRTVATNRTGVLVDWWVDLRFEDDAKKKRCALGETFEFPDKCVKCPAGKYLAEPGARTCRNCDAGKYSSAEGASSANTCVSCVAGKFLPTWGVDETDCLSCEEGKFSAMAGATENCQDCPAGKFAAEFAAEACQNCPAGKYTLPMTVGATSLAHCFDCPVGKYSAVVAARSQNDCSFCPAGKTSPPGSGSQDECAGCSATHFLARDMPEDVCYNSEDSGALAWQGECAPCPLHSKNDRSGGTSFNDCSCEKGWKKVMDESMDQGIFTCAVQDLCSQPRPCHRNAKKDRSLSCVPGSTPISGKPKCVCDPRAGYMPKKVGKEASKGCTGLSRPVDQCRLDFHNVNVSAGQSSALIFQFQLYSDLPAGEHIAVSLPGFDGTGFELDIDGANQHLELDFSFLEFPIPRSGMPPPLGIKTVRSDGSSQLEGPWTNFRPRWVQHGSGNRFEDIWKDTLDAPGCFHDYNRSKSVLLAQRIGYRETEDDRCGDDVETMRKGQFCNAEAPFCSADGYCVSQLDAGGASRERSSEYDFPVQLCSDPLTHKGADRIVATVDECAALASARGYKGFCIAHNSECYLASAHLAGSGFKHLGAVSGLQWVYYGNRPPSGRRELANEELGEALGNRTHLSFTREELADFGIDAVDWDHFVKIPDEDSYYTPLVEEALPCDPASKGLGGTDSIQCYHVLNATEEIKALNSSVRAFNAKWTSKQKMMTLTAMRTIPMGTIVRLMTSNQLKVPAYGLAEDSATITIFSSSDKRTVKKKFKTMAICKNPPIAPEPPKIIEQINNRKPLDLTFRDVGDVQTKLTIPKGGFPDNAQVKIQLKPFDDETTPLSETQTTAGPVVRFEVLPPGTKALKKLASQLKVSMTVLELFLDLVEDAAQVGRRSSTQSEEPADDARTIISTELLQHWFNSNTNQWIPIPGVSLDQEEGTLSSDIPIEVLVCLHATPASENDAPLCMSWR